MYPRAHLPLGSEERESAESLSERNVKLREEANKDLYLITGTGQEHHPW